MKTVRSRFDVRGQVQGVGFRPYVYRLARELGLNGQVANDTQGVTIDVEGPPNRVAAFAERLPAAVPPLVRIDSMSATPDCPNGQGPFVIRPSIQPEGPSGAEPPTARVTPDSCICADCRRELRDPQDRRYGYAFINCTNCGPRYSIIRAVPYDRPNTTMARFQMCPACQAEYDDPGDRRFHAQPNACPDCGPRLWLVQPDGVPVQADPIAATAAALANGKIVAIKGIGGFHLACRADDDAVVDRLRQRKRRETKPFAIMVADLAAARRIAVVTGPDAALLTSAAAPIVLLPKQPGAAIAAGVAPGTASYGVMLPYSPLHVALFDRGLGPLVMTSGNPCDEPLCADNDDALRRLGGLADLLLLHDRDIHAPNDDSVMVGSVEPAIPLRRARGYTPRSVQVDRAADRPILALGGDLKATFCVLNRDQAVLSEHLGELSSVTAYRHYVDRIDRLSELLMVEPQRIVHDLHPGYQSTALARRLGSQRSIETTAVQHHHAHIASCLADNGWTGPAVGIACDGTGYGSDGAIWGCEVQVCRGAEFERAAHLRYYGLPGGDAAARETWRPAASLLYETYGPDWRQAAPDAFANVDDRALNTAARMIEQGVNCPPTSSLGRLFDAVAFLIGLGSRNGHEAQAAMALESAALSRGGVRPLPCAIDEDNKQELMLLDVRPMIEAIVVARAANRPVAEIAAAFHATIAAMLAEAAVRVARAHGIATVALSGGCFLNRLLLEDVRRCLRDRNLNVLVHRQVPPGDGGLSLGQAVIADRRDRGGI
ncbi:MAG: carbamoyltransferase HypF [bacterium]|nr:carbamoyltransferase HypF [bacterium]